jgi:hypothetical protein
MEISQILMGLVIVGGLVGYYWFKVGRHGGTAGYQKNLMGLRDGEVLASQWNAYFDFDQSTGDKVFDAVAGMTTRGKHLYVGITNKDRLIIAHMEDSRPPMSFEIGEVAIIDHAEKAKVGSMASMQGMEQAKVIQFLPAVGEPFRLQIAASAADALKAWAARASKIEGEVLASASFSTGQPK